MLEGRWRLGWIWLVGRYWILVQYVGHSPSHYCSVGIRNKIIFVWQNVVFIVAITRAGHSLFFSRFANR